MLLVLLACTPSTPVALVYRGPAGCDGCSEAVAHALRTADDEWDVRFVGPDDEDLSPAALESASLYAQPGGEGTVRAAFGYVEDDADALTAWVADGGRYVGFCMGGYFAGFDPGYGMLPGDSGQLIAEPGAEVTDEADTTITVDWGGETRTLYFQDGPYFVVDDETGVDVLATYVSTGEIAAMVAPYGEGRVGVVGPHPEATQDWYDVEGITDPDGLDTDLAQELIARVME